MDMVLLIGPIALVALLAYLHRNAAAPTTPADIEQWQREQW